FHSIVFFPLYVDHRSLHSFPTRRSSDLDTRSPLIISDPNYSKGSRSYSVVELLDIYPTLCELADLPEPSHLQGKSLVPILKDPEDRKSTRLNSSHVKISYAVFCLKKKNN